MEARRKRASELMEEIDRKIDTLWKNRIINDLEARLLGRYLQDLTPVGREELEERIRMLEAMDTLLTMALQGKGPRKGVDDLSEVIAYLRILDPRIRPAGSTSLDLYQRVSGELTSPPELYEPGTPPRKARRIVVISHPNFGEFVRSERLQIVGRRDHFIREAINLLAELALRRPVDLRGDEFLQLPGGGIYRLRYPSYPSNNPLKVYLSYREFIKALSDLLHPLREKRIDYYAKRLEELTEPWYLLFLSWRELKNSPKASQEAKDLILNEYMSNLGRIVAENVLKLKRKRETTEEIVNTLVGAALARGLLTHLQKKVKDQGEREKLKEDIYRFLDELRHHTLKHLTNLPR